MSRERSGKLLGRVRGAVQLNRLRRLGGKSSLGKGKANPGPGGGGDSEKSLARWRLEARKGKAQR